MMLEKSEYAGFLQVFQPTRILTADNAIGLRDWAKDAIASGTSILLVDCSQVSFMDSSGLGSLVSLNQMVQQAGSQLRICSLQGQARMLFEMTNLHNFFHIYPDRNTAQAVSDSKSSTASATL
ncbi:MAG: STAS domain-containing protein [Cyanobacteria bacterium P01_F01_bin.150]